MKHITFTDKYIKGLKPQKTKYSVGDGQGLTLQILPSGKKTWYYRYNLGNKDRRLNLGHYPDVSLAEARLICSDHKKLVVTGIDPIDKADNLKKENLKSPTVATLIDTYIKNHAMKSKKSWKKDKARLERDILPFWGTLKAKDIKRQDVSKRLQSIVDRGAPILANRIFEVIRHMFNWAISQAYLEHSPCDRLKAPVKNTQRKRHLSELELIKFFHALNSNELIISDKAVRALKLILCTAQRPGEVLNMHISEIDGNWWTIPGHKVKNENPHRVYLSQTALNLIRADDPPGYVFESPIAKNKNKPFGETALSVAVNRNREIWGIDHFTPHDLRRTAATLLSRLGYSDEVIDAILNHVKKGIIKVYNQHEYDEEKVEAMAKLETAIANVVSGNSLKPKTKEQTFMDNLLLKVPKNMNSLF